MVWELGAFLISKISTSRHSSVYTNLTSFQILNHDIIAMLQDFPVTAMLTTAQQNHGDKKSPAPKEDSRVGSGTAAMSLREPLLKCCGTRPQGGQYLWGTHMVKHIFLFFSSTKDITNGHK